MPATSLTLFERVVICCCRLGHRDPGASFQLFLGGQTIFLFFNATGLLKNWEKQHFICSNLTLFVVPFFLSFFFLFFSVFLSFFIFFFFLGGGGGGVGDGPQPHSNDAPAEISNTLDWQDISTTDRHVESIGVQPAIGDSYPAIYQFGFGWIEPESI